MKRCTYPTEYISIAKVFFRPYHVDRCCTNVLTEYCCFIRHSCNDVSEHRLPTTHYNSGTADQQWEHLDQIVTSAIIANNEMDR